VHHLGIIGNRLVRQVDSVLGQEDQALHRPIIDGNDYFIKEASSPTGNIQVTIMDRVESTGETSFDIHLDVQFSLLSIYPTWVN
jgi:hypothetical protein